MNAIHHTTALTMLHSGDPVDLSFWKRNGEIVHLLGCIALPNKAAARYSGTQNFKVLASGQIRKIRLVCIFRAFSALTASKFSYNRAAYLADFF